MVILKDDKSDGTDAKLKKAVTKVKILVTKMIQKIDLSGKLVVWTLAVDLEDFSEKFKEESPGVELETVK